MRALALAILGLVAAALLPVTSAEALPAAPDPVDCARSLVVAYTFCEVLVGGCTSTSRCTAAGVWVPGKVYGCVDVFCTPYLPNCIYVTVWYTDEPDDPTVSEGGCLLLPIEQ